MESEKPSTPSDDFKQALIRKAAEIDAQRKRDGFIAGQENYRFSYPSCQTHSNGFGGPGYDRPEPKLEIENDSVVLVAPGLFKRIWLRQVDFWKRFWKALMTPHEKAFLKDDVKLKGDKDDGLQ